MARPRKNKVVDVSETNAQARAAGKTYGEFVAEQTKKQSSLTQMTESKERGQAIKFQAPG